MRQEQVLVTPEMAAQLLGRNGELQRPLRPSTVRYFSEQLRSGRAGTTHQGIAIDQNGHLQDGQHRCQAIVETGIPWLLWIAYDCPKENFHLIDVGAKRSVSDFLHIRGYKDTKHLAAVGQIAWQWYRGRASFTGSTTDDQLVDLFDRYPSIIDAGRAPTKNFGIAGTLLSFLAYIGPEEFVADLLNDVADPSTMGGKLAEKYEDRHAKGRIAKKTAVALFIKAANEFIVGSEIPRSFRFSPTEAFPKPKWTTPIPFGAAADENDEE
jgi:hypothetical protein